MKAPFLLPFFLACDSVVPSESDPCGEADCSSSTLTLAAEVHPASGETSLVACEFPPGDFETTDHGLRIELANAAQVEVHVFEEQSKVPIPASVVWSRPSLISGRPVVAQSVDTDENGVAILSLLPVDPAVATYEVTVTPHEPANRIYPPKRVSGLVIEAGESSLEVPITAMEALTVISGRVEDPSGYSATLGGLQVRGVISADQSETSVGIVDSDTGKFVLRAEPFSGPFRIEVESAQGTGPSFWYDAELLEDTPDLEIVATLPVLSPMQDFCMVAQGVDASGGPSFAAGAQIKFEADLSDLIVGDGSQASGLDGVIFVAEAVADTAGQASISLLPGSSEKDRLYDVGVLPAPGSPLMAKRLAGFAVPASSEKCRLLDLDTLDVRPTISGVVMATLEDGSQRVIEGATVEAVPVAEKSENLAEDLPALPAPPANTQTSTDPAGNYLLWVDTGTYDLECQPGSESNWPRWWRRTSPIDQDTSDVDLVLPLSVVSEVAVTRSDATSVAGAAVRFFLLSEEENPRLIGEGTTGEDGLAYIRLPR